MFTPDKVLVEATIDSEEASLAVTGALHFGHWKLLAVLSGFETQRMWMGLAHVEHNMCKGGDLLSWKPLEHTKQRSRVCLAGNRKHYNQKRRKGNICLLFLVIGFFISCLLSMRLAPAKASAATSFSEPLDVLLSSDWGKGLVSDIESESDSWAGISVLPQ